MKTLSPLYLEKIILCPKLAKYYRTIGYVFCILTKEHESHVINTGKFLEKEISTTRILAEPWSLRRFGSVMSAMIGGVSLPPVSVQENIWNGELFYTLVDGNHRTAIARKFRRRTVSSEISGTAKCDTSKARFYDEILYHQDADDPETYSYTMGQEHVEFAACCFLKAMGVESRYATIWGRVKRLLLLIPLREAVFWWCIRRAVEKGETIGLHTSGLDLCWED